MCYNSKIHTSQCQRCHKIIVQEMETKKEKQDTFVEKLALTGLIWSQSVSSSRLQMWPRLPSSEIAWPSKQAPHIQTCALYWSKTYRKGLSLLRDTWKDIKMVHSFSLWHKSFVTDVVENHYLSVNTDVLTVFSPKVKKAGQIILSILEVYNFRTCICKTSRQWWAGWQTWA